jgi:hypothetical protein
MATAPNTLEAFNAAADMSEAQDTATEPANKEFILEFEVDGYGKPVVIDLQKLPDDIKVHLLKTATKSYVTNRVSTAESTAKKSNALFDSYDAAQKNNPLQTDVPPPSGERNTVDYVSIVERALNALYTGEIGRRGGGGADKAPKDPLNAYMLRALVQKVFETKHAADPKYGYLNAKAEVGPSAMAYINKSIAESVALGADEKQTREYLEAKYIRPARVMAGLDKLGGKFKDFEGIL